jgi:hypothetical protein
MQLEEEEQPEEEEGGDKEEVDEEEAELDTRIKAIISTSDITTVTIKQVRYSSNAAQDYPTCTAPTLLELVVFCFGTSGRAIIVIL